MFLANINILMFLSDKYLGCFKDKTNKKLDLNGLPDPGYVIMEGLNVHLCVDYCSQQVTWLYFACV